MNAGVNHILRSLGNQASTRSITSSVHSPCPWRTLGLEQGASRGQIKRRYFELAKRTHPDTQAQDEAVSFLAVFAAYEKLIALEASTRTSGSAASWQPSGQPSSAGTCQGASRKFQDKRRGRVVHREKTRGEFLCHQLEKDPHAAPQLWETICSWQQPMEVTSAMLEELFKACGASSHGLDGAMKILRQGTVQGVLSPHMRLVALISMVKWCKEDRHSFERIQAEMRETERTSDARKLLMQADRLYPHFAESTLTAGLALDSYSA
jgi:hypothetical protein